MWNFGIARLIIKVQAKSLFHLLKRRILLSHILKFVFARVELFSGLLLFYFLFDQQQCVFQFCPQVLHDVLLCPLQDIGLQRAG